MSAAEPVRIASRFRSLDVLRGLALLGILVLNIDDFFGPEALHDIPVGVAKAAFVGWHARLDEAIFTVKWLFFEGKMRTLFAMLYGAGIVLLMGRLEGDGRRQRAKTIFYRRNLWLLLFGFLHGTLIWHGDILFEYASVALLMMLPLRKLGARTLIILGLSIGIVGGTIGLVGETHMSEVFAAADLQAQGRAALATGHTPSAAQRKALADAAAAQKQSGAALAESIREGQMPYLSGLLPRAEGYLEFVLTIFTSGDFLEVAGSMALGMGLYKNGFLLGAWSRARYAVVAAVGYLLATPIVLYGLYRSAHSGFAADVVLRWMALPYCVEVYAASLANAAIVLLIVKGGIARPVTDALANVGRTAFSNYILTSILCQSLFVWSSWPLYGHLEYYQQMYVVLGVWAINLAASAIWLKYFRFGPLEWAWRSLTYWRRQLLRIAASDRATRA